MRDHPSANTLSGMFVFVGLIIGGLIADGEGVLIGGFVGMLIEIIVHYFSRDKKPTTNPPSDTDSNTHSAQEIDRE